MKYNLNEQILNLLEIKHFDLHFVFGERKESQGLSSWTRYGTPRAQKLSHPLNWI